MPDLITCPKCSHQFPLTESLAAPLLAAKQRDFEQRLAQKDAEAAKREAKLHEREEALRKEKEGIDESVAEKLKQERSRIAAEAEKKARFAVGDELERKAKEVAELNEVLKARDVKLAAAQQAEAEFLRKKRELDDQKREMELTLERRLQEGLGKERETARKEAEESLKLKVMEKEQTISSLQKKLEEALRKADQGSQQMQGEVQELELEALLTERFSTDTIEPVPKGAHGGDVVQRVVSPTGLTCGVILWESKRTRNWSDGWLVKMRDDQRAARADIAIIVTQALPKGVANFDAIDGVWVTSRGCAIPVAHALRQSLIELAKARQAGDGQQTKMEIMYDYLMGPRFRQRVEAIVEAFSSMRDDLAKEQKAIMKQWAKREEQIDRVMTATVGMYGELQGIAGKTLKEIEGLNLNLLESDDPDIPE